MKAIPEPIQQISPEGDSRGLFFDVFRQKTFPA